ncbi:MAG: hypothetical protein BWY80_00413 [Firmicutes bacterium ADurb.Bin456]|nr:MAG: hypothetical protein BWY80_00413 [Firmicutes bacterium ADurb.Bin456]
MDGQPRVHLSDQIDNPRVGYNNPVHPGVINPADVFRQGFKIPVAGKNIGCYIDPSAPLMGKPDSLSHFYFVKIASPGPQAEMPPTEVDGIGSVGHGNL